MKDNQTVYKLNRIFNIIFNPQIYKFLIIVSVVLLAFCGYTAFRSGKEFIAALGSAVFFEIIFIASQIWNSPKKLLFDGKTAHFDDHVVVRRRFYKSGGTWRKVSYTVSDIKDVELSQNRIEKMFDVGRISFKGKAEVTAKKDLDQIIAKHSFTFYGVKNFSLVKHDFLNK